MKIKNEQADNEETFEWAPPDTTNELAADYMKALPENKLPIKGSAGAALRKQQLQKQLPLHDIDHKVCDELTESERKQFEKYLENLKKYVGQGKVLKVMGAKPFDKSLMTPVNASECFSPKQSTGITTGQPMTLRTPSSFVYKSNYSTPIGTNDGIIPLNHNLNSQINDSQIASSNLLPKSNYSTPLGTNEGIYNTNQNPNSIANELKAASSRLESIRGPLFAHTTDETAKLGRYYHTLANVENKSELAGSSNVPGKYNQSTNFSTLNKIPKNEKYHSPISTNGNSKPAIIFADNFGTNQEYSSANNNSIGKSMPLNKGQLNKRDEPTRNSMRKYGSKVQEIQTDYSNINQRPLQNQQLFGELQDLPAEKMSQADKDSRLADKILSDALRPPSAIHCSDIIGSTLDPVGLTNIREKLSAKYSAKDKPVELVNPMKTRELNRANNDEKNNYIPTMHNESIKTELNSKPINAQLSSYRGPENSIIRSENLQKQIFPEESVSIILENPIVDCLGTAFDNLSLSKTKIQKCQQCNEAISVGDVVVTAEKAEDAAWHPGCFVCSACNELLVDLVYFYSKGKLYCARDLANLLEIPRCFACDELIFLREYTVAEGHNYHVKHFCCWDCDIPLAGQQYISENDRPLCLLCYGKTYAKSCAACNKVIAADQQGVAVKNLNFHATMDCFCCASCKKSLLNGRMAIKEDKPFCSKECITIYVNQNKS